MDQGQWRKREERKVAVTRKMRRGGCDRDDQRKTGNGQNEQKREERQEGEQWKRQSVRITGSTAGD